MAKNNAITNLPDIVTTLDDKATLLESLASIKDLIYKKDQSAVMKTIEKIVPNRYFRIIEALFTNTDSVAGLDKEISSFEKTVAKLPSAHVTISYEPTKFQVGQLVNRLRRKLPSDTVIDYTVDHSIGIGIKIDFNGKTYTKTTEAILKT